MLVRRAFTLVELLAVVAVIAGLVTLLLPSLARTRDMARGSVSLGYLRQHGVVAAAYQNAWDGMFPYITDPSATETIIRFPDGRPPRRLRYFYAFFGWPFALGPSYYSGFPDPTFTSPFRRSVSGSTDYWYSCSLICRPEYWDRRARVAGRSQWRPSRRHEALYPSDKAVFIEVERRGMREDDFIGPTRPVRIGFVDGSASRLLVGDVRSGYPRGDGDPSQSVHPAGPPTGLHTIDGVRGRDR